MLTAAVGGDSDSPPEAPSAAVTRRRSRRRAVVELLALIARRLRLVAAAMVAIIVVGTVILTRLAHVNLWHGFYLAVLATIGGVDPDLTASASLQILHIIFALLSIALIPLVTATVVETGGRFGAHLAQSGRAHQQRPRQRTDVVAGPPSQPAHPRGDAAVR